MNINYIANQAKLRQEERDLGQLLNSQERQEIEEELDKERNHLRKKAFMSSLLLVTGGLGLGLLLIPMLNGEDNPIFNQPDRLGFLIFLVPLLLLIQYWQEMSQRTLKRRVELMEARLDNADQSFFSEEESEF